MYNESMTFEWDEAKNERNKAKHGGIGFELAVRVFLDEKRIEKYDRRPFYGNGRSLGHNRDGGRHSFRCLHGTR